MNKFLTSNSTKYRLLRTIIQGIIGVLLANVDLLVSFISIPTELKPMIVALVMAILSPIMSELGETEEPVVDEIEYFEEVEEVEHD